MEHSESFRQLPDLRGLLRTGTLLLVVVVLWSLWSSRMRKEAKHVSP